MKIINKLKTTKGMAIGILVLFSLVLGLSYGTFIFSTGNYRSTSMLISNLLYGIDITTTGGNETINTKTVTLPSGKTSTILLKITSLNDVESKYGVSYKINNGTGSVKYSSNTGWLPTGKINKNGTGTYEKVVKIVIEATSDLSVDFNVDGGYTYNDLNSTKDGYTRVTEMYEGITDYTESLKTIIENETSNNIYGGDAINNYLQYPEDTDTTKNIWRIIGYYESVDGIKIIANPVKETSTTNISTELTTFYNTLTKKSDYVLETNKFSCTGLNCTTSTYSNIGLLNTSEYSYIGGINSYLNENNYYVIDDSLVKNITSGNITEASTTSNLRPVIYLQSDVKVKGSGTITNPYKLSEKGDVVFASATLNGNSISFPKESDPYISKTVTCTNGSVGEWSTEKQKIILTTVNLPTSCVVDFTEGYTVTLNVINGSTSPVSKVVGRDGVTSFTVTPNSGYKLELESDTCKGTLSGNTYTISNITSAKSCSITFTPAPTLLSQILKDNPTIKTRTDFNTTFTETNTKTLYKATESIAGNTPKDVYYFAGDAKNNWVKFGIHSTELVKGYYSGSATVETFRIFYSMEKCTSSASYNKNCTYVYKAGDPIYWRIIRTNYDGSIRLLYSGTSPDTTCGYIGGSKFNSTNNDPMYVGYMYGTTGSLENNRLNTNNSTIKTTIDNWYNNNLSSYSKYISTEAVYCNDRELASGVTYNTGNTTFYYASYERLYTNTTPTYNCTNIKDAFSGNNSEAKLTYPIGLMTADEITYAGGKRHTILRSPYVWYYLNSAGESITGSTTWWALSPRDWRGSVSRVWDVYGSASPGVLYFDGDVVSSFSVRPVISLKSCIKYSTGNGTPETPYEIMGTSSGC